MVWNWPSKSKAAHKTKVAVKVAKDHSKAVLFNFSLLSLGVLITLIIPKKSKRKIRIKFFPVINTKVDYLFLFVYVIHLP
jgi:hypothetical protein